MSDTVLLVRERLIERWRTDADLLQATDQVAEEVPVALVYNDISYAVMIATPSALEQFALGFSITEAIVEAPEEVFSIESSNVDLDLGPGIQIDIEISQRRVHALKARRRNLTGRTGCGLCGTESLEGAIRPIKQVVTQPLIPPEIIDKAVYALSDSQPLQQMTGAAHAAAWCNSRGEIALIFEDVGRHNALDKLVGELTNQHIDTTQGFALITSRGSYEIIHKSAAAGISTLVTLSAPTALACRLAEQAGINLVGFARPGKQVIYHRELI